MLNRTPLLLLNFLLFLLTPIDVSVGVEKAPGPTVSTVAGRETFVRPQPIKHSLPMVLIPLGIVTSVILSQPTKARSPKAVTFIPSILAGISILPSASGLQAVMVTVPPSTI